MSIQYNKKLLIESMEKLIIAHYLNGSSMEQSYDDVINMFESSIKKMEKKYDDNSLNMRELILNELGDYANENNLKEKISEIYSRRPTIDDLSCSFKV